MHPTPYLFFNGNCAEAIAWYAEIFGGEITQQMPASEMPPQFPVPEDRKSWVMHSTIKIGEGELMASDHIMGEAPKMAGSSVMMRLKTASDGKAAFDKLADDGEIEMPWAPTFWSAGFGCVTDRYGVRWMIGCDEEPVG